MASGSMDDSHLLSLWEDFVQNYCTQDLETLEANYPTKRSLVVDFGNVQRHDPELAAYLLDKPDIAIEALEKVIKKPTAGSLEDVPFEPHVRISGVPENNLLVQNISSVHIERLITIKGIITKRAEVWHKVKVALYKCMMCDHVLRFPRTKKSITP